MPPKRARGGRVAKSKQTARLGTPPAAPAKPKPYKFRPTEKNRRRFTAEKSEHNFPYLHEILQAQEEQNPTSPTTLSKLKQIQDENPTFSIPQLFKYISSSDDDNDASLILEPLFLVLALPQKTSPITPNQKTTIELSLRSQSPNSYLPSTPLGALLSTHNIKRELSTIHVIDALSLKNPPPRHPIEISTETTPFDHLLEVTSLTSIHTSDHDLAALATHTPNHIRRTFFKPPSRPQHPSLTSSNHPNFDASESSAQTYWSTFPLLITWTATVVRLERLFLADSGAATLGSVNTFASLQLTGWPPRSSAWLTARMGETWDPARDPEGGAMARGEFLGAKYWGLGTLVGVGADEDDGCGGPRAGDLRPLSWGPLRGDTKVARLEVGVRFEVRGVVESVGGDGEEGREREVRVRLDWGRHGREGRVVLEVIGLSVHWKCEGGVEGVRVGGSYRFQGIVPAPVNAVEMGEGGLLGQKWVVHEYEEL